MTGNIVVRSIIMICAFLLASQNVCATEINPVVTMRQRLVVGESSIEYLITFTATPEPSEWVCMLSVPDTSVLPWVSDDKWSPAPAWTRRLDTFAFQSTSQVQVRIKPPSYPGQYRVTCEARYYTVEPTAVGRAEWNYSVAGPSTNTQYMPLLHN